MAATLDKVLTVPEIAALAGWSRRRMLRHLLKLNEEVLGMLLHNTGSKDRPRYTATLPALQAIAPQWFSDPETVQAQLEAIRADVRRLRLVVDMHSTRLAALVG